MRGLRVAVMDARELAFREAFDGVLSNAVLHWIRPPDRVAAGVWNCLKPAGRFVGEFGGCGNVERVRRALHRGLARRGIDPAAVDPWYYPSPEEYSAVLEHAGFTVEYSELIPRPTRLPGDIMDWLAVFAQAFITALPETERGRYLDTVRESLAPELHDRSGSWTLDYVRLRFAARK
jgi:SAM-dependent methyltransferase